MSSPPKIEEFDDRLTLTNGYVASFLHQALGNRHDRLPTEVV